MEPHTYDMGHRPDANYNERPPARLQRSMTVPDLQGPHRAPSSNGFPGGVPDTSHTGRFSGQAPLQTARFPPGSITQGLAGHSSHAARDVDYGGSFSSYDNHPTVPHIRSQYGPATMNPHLDHASYAASNQALDGRAPHSAHANLVRRSHSPHSGYRSHLPRPPYQYPPEQPAAQSTYTSRLPHPPQPYHAGFNQQTFQQYLEDPLPPRFPSDPFYSPSPSRAAPVARSPCPPELYQAHPHHSSASSRIPQPTQPLQASHASSCLPRSHVETQSSISPHQSAEANVSGQWTTYAFEHYDPHIPTGPSQKGKQVAGPRSTRPVQRPGQPTLPPQRGQSSEFEEQGEWRGPAIGTALPTSPSQAPQTDRPGPSTAGQMGLEEQEIPESATIETLLESGFIPPFVSMGEDMPREEQEAMFQALSLEDKKRVLESFLTERQSPPDAVHQPFPHSGASDPTPTVQEKASSSQSTTHERFRQKQADGTHFGVVLLNAIQDMGDNVGRRLNSVEESIHGINDKVSELQSERVAFTQPANSRQQPLLSRAKARRIAALNAASEELGAVAPDDGTQRAGSRTTTSNGSKPDPDDPYIKALLKCVRLHCDHELLKVKSAKDVFATWPPMSDAEEEARGPITDRAEFCIDFVRGWKTSSLNGEARDYFGDDFFAAYRGGEFDHHGIPARYFQRELVLDLLDSHISNLRAEYAKARRGDKAKDEKIRQRKNANTRQSTTLEQRLNTVTNPVHGIQRHAVLLNKLRPPHVEPDEPAGFRIDDDGKKHRVFNMLRPAWQSDSFWQFMKDLDRLKAQADEEAIGASRKPGALARDRVELAQPKVVNTAAPKGLWRNCYDEAWLSGLKLPSLRTLEVREGDYDFSLDYHVEQGV